MTAYESTSLAILLHIASGLEAMMIQNQVLLNAATLGLADADELKENSERTRRLYEMAATNFTEWQKTQEKIRSLLSDAMAADLSSKLAKAQP